jgi:hypothetical protein
VCTVVDVADMSSPFRKKIEELLGKGDTPDRARQLGDARVGRLHSQSVTLWTARTNLPRSGLLELPLSGGRTRGGSDWVRYPTNSLITSP